MEKKFDNKEGNLNRAHLYPRILGYKKWNDIYEGVGVISYWQIVNVTTLKPLAI